MSDISVVIPCIPKHLKYLEELISSIDDQTILPYQIIISISDYNDNDSKVLQEFYNINFPNLNIVILNQLNEAYAGENRNRGCKVCTTKYVTFIDADDLMVKNKIEIVLELFQNNDMDALIHTFGDKDTNKLFDNETMKIVKEKSRCIWLNHNCIGLKNIIHHGHITVKKSIFDVIHQDSSMKRGQDSHFVREIINNDFKLYLIDKSLSIYRPQYSSSRN